MEASVSVIIPCYNSSKTLGRAIQSVVKQTLCPSEILLVNDGSEDNTLEVLLELQSLYGSDWIKVISLEQNSGVSIARNTAWNLATQKYVAFLDSDDVWCPDKIYVQYSWMVSHPEIILSGHRFYAQITSNEATPKPVLNYVREIPIYKKKLLFVHQFFTPSVMLKRQIEYRFNEKKRLGEDTLLWLEIVSSGHSSVLLDVVLAYGFKHNYGDSGLSGNLWEMEKAQQNNFVLLFKALKITFIELFLVSVWSFIKYIRRLIIVFFLIEVKSGK